MKKRIITFIFALFLIIPLCLTLTACKDKNKEEPTPQVTMVHINEALGNAGSPSINGIGATNLELDMITAYTEEELIEFKVLLERGNIDPSSLIIVDIYKYTASNSAEFLTIVAKFKTTDYATQFYNLSKVDDQFDSKQYGNLVVCSYNLISTFVFNAIDSIQV